MKEIVLTPDNLNLYDILDYHSCSSSLPNDEKLPIPLKTIELMKLKYSITDVVFTKYLWSINRVLCFTVDENFIVTNRGYCRNYNIRELLKSDDKDRYYENNFTNSIKDAFFNNKTL